MADEVKMSDPTPRPPRLAPSTRELFRSTLLAAVVAAVLLVTVVWPAEFGVDVTGVGTVLGLTPMGKVKAELAREAAGHATTPESAAGGGEIASSDSSSSAVDSTASRSDVTEIVLPPGKGKEIKLIMQSGARATYTWSAVGGPVDFETHGEPFNAPADVYESYEKGTEAQSDEGVLTAPFSGKHGWYWHNRGSANVTVRLESRGQYREVRIIE
jgi:hypothetical protein